MKELLKKLDRVLEEEKKCLLDGKYTQLESLVEVKVQLSDAIASQASILTKEAIVYIDKKLKRNEALLQSAQRGIKSAMAHLHEVAENPFQSYTKDGHRSPLAREKKVSQNL